MYYIHRCIILTWQLSIPHSWWGQVRHDHPSGFCVFLVSQAALAHFAEQVAAPFQEEWRPQEMRSHAPAWHNDSTTKGHESRVPLCMKKCPLYIFVSFRKQKTSNFSTFPIRVQPVRPCNWPRLVDLATWGPLKFQTLWRKIFLRFFWSGWKQRKVRATQDRGVSFFLIHQIESIFPNKHWKGFWSDIMVTDSVDLVNLLSFFAPSDYIIVTCAFFFSFFSVWICGAMCHWQWNAPQVFFLFQVHSPRHEIRTNHSTTMIFIFTYFIEAMHYMYIYNTHTHTRTCLQDVYILYTYITILLIFLLLLSMSSLCGLSKLVLVHLRFCPRSKGHTLSDSRKLTPKSIVKWGMGVY